MVSLFAHLKDLKLSCNRRDKAEKVKYSKQLFISYWYISQAGVASTGTNSFNVVPTNTRTNGKAVTRPFLELRRSFF